MTQIVSAAELIAATFPEPRWAVPGIVPEGLTVIAARPKIGKSWLMLGVGIAVASGGRALGMVGCDPGDVLYLALEDTARRLQSRLVTMLDDPRSAPERLHLVTSWARLDAGGLDELAAWLTAHPDARLVILDTLAKVRPGRKRDAALYDEDYAALNGLKQLADRFGVAIVVVHHTRKADAGDVFDTVSGTLGLSAVADAIIVIRRNRGTADALLSITGRDVEEAELPLRWEASIGAWSVLDLPTPTITDERGALLSYVRGNAPVTPAVTAAALGRTAGSTRKLMWEMAQAGLLTGDGVHGYYVTVTGVTGNGSNGGNAGNGAEQ